MRWFGLALSLSFCLVRAADEDEDQDDHFHFVTRPDIEAPKWDIQTYHADELQQGLYWFISPYANIHQKEFPLWNGPLIYDTNGELIWSGAPHVDYINVMDFRMCEVNGQKMLSYIWNKDGRNVEGAGNGIILDSSYELYTIVDMVGNSSKWNFHELNVIDDGKRALMALSQDFTPVPISVPAYNGSCKIAKQGFKEVDVKTGEIYFEWHTLGRISPEESVYVGDDIKNNTWEEKCANNWDIAHINAVDKFNDGDYLISARHTDTIYKVSHRDHSIVWRLGGRWNDFLFEDQRIRFGQQHHARVRGQNETHTLISLFDNAAGGGSVENLSNFESWGLLVALRTDVAPMTAELVARFGKPFFENSRILTKSRGSMDILPNGNVFMGWVFRSHVAEYTPDGKLLMTAMLKNELAASYRSYKMSWIGRPAQPPDVVAIARERNGAMSTIVHVSWNGATEVATWNLLHTNSFGTITTLMASTPRQGFETRFIVDSFAEYVIAVGLDRNGIELGRSRVIIVQVPPALHTPALDHSEKIWTSNHSSAWWEAEPIRAETLERSSWVYVGFAVFAGLICAFIGLWLWLRTKRRETAWWVVQGRTSKSGGSSDADELDQHTFLLYDKEDYETEDESEENTRSSQEG